MQGSIGFESDLGKGSRFFIEMNLCEKPDFDEESLEQDSGLPIEESKKQNKKLILYVEDNPANLDLVKRIFTYRKDIELISAPDALKGIELAENNQPDLILMDIHLPGMDGLTAFKKMKEKNKTKNIPVIAVSADAMDVDKKKALNAGFVEYITKPLDITVFPEKINQIIR
jgi:CheY-like chemotaxis protein